MPAKSLFGVRAAKESTGSNNKEGTMFMDGLRSNKSYKAFVYGMDGVFADRHLVKYCDISNFILKDNAKDLILQQFGTFHRCK